MIGTLAGPIYVEASALVKLYLPEAGSEVLNTAVAGRADLLISDLAVTEVVSALSRKRREGSLSGDVPRMVQAEILQHMRAGVLQAIELLPRQYREAEELLLHAETALRAADALHLALALAGQARSMISYDRGLRAAAQGRGLVLFPAAV